jgi:hypothetical protein
MRHIVLLVAVLLGPFGAAQAANEKPIEKPYFTVMAPPDDPISNVFGDCGHPCRIRYNDGGNLQAFLDAAQFAKDMGRTFRITGECYSACILFADKVRPNVCLENDAAFHFQAFRFHTWAETWQFEPSPFLNIFFPDKKGIRGFEFKVFYEPDHSPDIAEWLEVNGPAPIHDWLDMSFTQASAFWQVCGGPPNPRLRPPR